MTSKAERAAARRSWPVRKTTLAQEDDVGLVAGTPSELVAMVWRLTQDAWAMSGAPYPTYSRGDMPGRLIRRAE
ncbi:MAG: hypothetical protein SF187_11855 [Deltaproteobacteria bacterium]|nr:hypothetical protein [Deltaproteobacteria bacterium]